LIRGIVSPRRWALLGVTALAAVLSGCVTTGGGAQSAVLRAKERVAPALVHIRPVKEVFARGERQEVSVIGSGFIISPDGYVVTNEHVAGESEMVKCVLSDKSQVDAEVVGTDPYTDLAVLKLHVDHPLPHVAFGTSAELEAGNMVLALGSPHGLARSVSLGIVSVPDRYLEDMGPQRAPYNNWIQTDAAINPGNSGGPLVNLRGEVVGVNARVLRGAENVGFAIPADVAREVSDEIIATGRVQRGRVGLKLQEMMARTDDPSQRGVVIAGVEPLSPAAQADIRPGDLLVAVNGEEVNARFEEDLPAVRKLMADLPVGEEALLTLLRGAERVLLHVVTDEQSELKGDQLEFAAWAFTASELTPEVVQRARLESPNGVLVSGVQPGGTAAQAGLRPGDIILEVDEAPVENLSQFSRTCDALVESGKARVLLYVKQGALTRFVLVKQDGANAAGDTHSGEGGPSDVE